jgi:lipid A 3-O-deacylase
VWFRRRELPREARATTEISHARVNYGCDVGYWLFNELEANVKIRVMRKLSMFELSPNEAILKHVPTLRLGATVAIASAMLLLAPTRALADQFGIEFAGGTADHGVNKGDLGLVWNPGLSWWEAGGYHVEVVGEAHASYWDIRESGAVNSGIWELGVTPVLRFVRSTGRFRPYIEAGIGVRMLSHVRETADRTFSSSFQFADMVGVGLQFGSHQNYRAGYRFQHLSNAGIKHPNPGINFSEVYVQYDF